ncbi:CHAT domain-containing protein [Sorangium sp. So ce1151]|uniref:CHAT domain-containing protein n=1 Tax=Sorangium sp. So ce1151 TaxID=3133332 RepID=UPI003F626C46
MPHDLPLWIKLAIENVGEDVFVTPHGSAGESRDKQRLEPSANDLARFQQRIGERATPHLPLDEGRQREAQQLFQDVFRDKVLELAADYVGRSRPGRLLVRLAVADQLKSVPWEVCHARTGGALDTDGSIGASPRLHVVRDVTGGGPAKPLRILGRVRVLVLAAARTGVATGIEAALAPAVDARVVDPIDVISDAQVSTLSDLRKALQLRSAPPKRPHILHIIGHGAVSKAPGEQGRPVLALPGGAGEPIEIPVQTLADDLVAIFGDDLRLIVLDACEGAAPGVNGSAAEILARRSAAAVVAHLWPLQSWVATSIAKSFYTSLTLWDAQSGDVAASLQSARRELAAEGAGAFSPVLYLRGASPVLFDFRGRKRSTPAPSVPSSDSVDELLGPEGLLRRRFSLLLGDMGEEPLDWQEALRSKLAKELAVPVAELPSLGGAIVRHVLAKGRQELDRLFRDLFDELLNSNAALFTPLAWELARILKPGVHATLLWLPMLEHALADRHPDRNIYVAQPGRTSLWSRYREAGKSEWAPPADDWPNTVDFTRDYVVLRPYGGLLPMHVVMGTVLTEEDHALNSRGTEMPEDWDSLANQLRTRAALLVGVSLLDWRHRMILRRLFDARLPAKSIAVLPPGADGFEQMLWTKRGGGLSDIGARSVGVVVRDNDALADLIARFTP